MEKQKLTFHQTRLLDRGVAEMTLLHISACKGVPSDMVMKTLQLGIAILRGGNINIQMVNNFHSLLCFGNRFFTALMEKKNGSISQRSC